MEKDFYKGPLKNVAADIDVGYGFGLRKKLRIKTWKRSMTKKKKVVRNFGRINEHFGGKNAKRFSETPLKSGKKISEKIWPPDSEVLDPPVIRSIASLALTIVWALDRFKKKNFF